MSDIKTCLKKILTAVYGKDVRQSIHDAIQGCDEKVEDLKKNMQELSEELSAQKETVENIGKKVDEVDEKIDTLTIKMDSLTGLEEIKVLKLNDDEMIKDCCITTKSFGIGGNIEHLDVAMAEGEYYCRKIAVRKNDKVSLFEDVILSSATNPFMLVADSEHVLDQVISYGDLNRDRTFEIKKDGYITFSHKNNGNVKEILKIERPGAIYQLQKEVEALKNVTVAEDGNEVAY